MIERRAMPRVTPEKPLKAKVRAFVSAKVLDISTCGVQIELPQSLPPHVACDLRFQVDDGEVILRGVVRRCRVWGSGSDEKAQRVLLYRAGLEFDEASRQKVTNLGSLFLGSGMPERTGKLKEKPRSNGKATREDEAGIEISFDEEAPKRLPK